MSATPHGSVRRQPCWSTIGWVSSICDNCCRIRVAVVSGALNVMQECIAGHYSCGAQVIPGLLRNGDITEIGSLIAPRPCIWEVGLQDKLIDPRRGEIANERMKRAYTSFGVADQLRIDRYDGGHRWNGNEAVPLLRALLR